VRLVPSVEVAPTSGGIAARASWAF
jgi:hypothetical protein